MDCSSYTIANLTPLLGADGASDFKDQCPLLAQTVEFFGDICPMVDAAKKIEAQGVCHPDSGPPNVDVAVASSTLTATAGGASASSASSTSSASQLAHEYLTILATLAAAGAAVFGASSCPL